MNSRSPRFETIAYLLAFLLAFGLRFVRLGALALTDSEAALALQALHIVQGESPALGSNVAYINLTSILFFVFGSSNFLARFWPALAGSALVLVPWLFRERITARPALILAFFLAIDPALVAVSRTAGGSILAVTGALLAVAFWQRGQVRLAGVFAALALLGGPGLWSGLLGILIAWLIAQFVAPPSIPVESELPLTDTPDTPTPEPTPEPIPAPEPPNYRSLIVTTVLTLLAASTLLLFAPQGLGAWLASLPEYLRGWVSPVSVPTSRMLSALAVYQPLGILLAFIAILRGWVQGDRVSIRLSMWLIVALLLAVFYPARIPADLIWTLFPLWILAAIELARHVDFPSEDRLVSGGLIVFMIFMLGLTWIYVSALYWTPLPSVQGNMHLLRLLGLVIFLMGGVVLVGFGWSERVASAGASWGIIIMLGLYTLGAAWSTTGLRVPNSLEHYRADATIAQADLLAQTVSDISEWGTGQATDLQVTVFGVDSPALLWALRNHNPIVVTVLDPTSMPALVVTPPMQNLQLAAAYRGQDFSWRQTPSWDSFPAYTLRWFTLRELPLLPETIVLWARDDLFIDAEQ